MELINQLTKTLGITEDQAKAGAGSVFAMAQDKLESSEFSQVSQAIPEVSDLMKFAPKSESPIGAIADLAPNLGGGLSSMGNLANLTGSFSKIGLNSDMIAKFLPIILSFVTSRGGNPVSNILSKVLK